MTEVSEYSLQCHYYTYKNKDRGLLRDHEIICSTASHRYQCHLCLRRFDVKHSLYRHVAGHQKQIIEGGITCIYCNERLPDRHWLYEHLRIHSEYDCMKPEGRTKFCKCPKCEFVGKGYTVVVDHMVKHTEKGKFECKICFKGFSRARKWKEHEAKHNRVVKEKAEQEEYIRSCRYCPVKIKDRSELRNHENSCSLKEKPFKCDVCFKRFKQRVILNYHLNCHKTKKVKDELICLYCDETFQDSFSLHEHLSIHEEYDFADPGEKEVVCKCPQCDYAGHGYHRVLIHFTQHKGDRKFVCKICNKGFRTITTLRVHETCHKGAVRSLCCYCGVGFRNYYSKSKHESEHLDLEGNVHFKCQECGEDQKTSEQFAIHYQTHYDERKFECKFCGAKFASQPRLWRHMFNMHEEEAKKEAHADPSTNTLKEIQEGLMLEQLDPENEKKSYGPGYICKYCGKKFFGVAALRVHSSVHTEERSFACITCPASFKTKNDLVQHQRTHNRNFSNKCLDCDLEFEDKGSFNQHIKTHPGYLRHECNICGERFALIIQLDVHSRQHNGKSKTNLRSTESEAENAGAVTVLDKIVDTDRMEQCNEKEVKRWIHHSSAEIELTRLPLVCALQSTALKIKDRIFIVWIKRDEADLLASARRNHSICIISDVTENNSEYNIRSMEATPRKGSLYSLSFGTLKFVLTTFGQLDKVLKNRHLESLKDLVRLLSQHSSGGVTHVITHTNRRTLDWLKEESKENIIVCNYI